MVACLSASIAGLTSIELGHPLYPFQVEVFRTDITRGVKTVHQRFRILPSLHLPRRPLSWRLWEWPTKRWAYTIQECYQFTANSVEEAQLPRCRKNAWVATREKSQGTSVPLLDGKRSFNSLMQNGFWSKSPLKGKPAWISKMWIFLFWHIFNWWEIISQHFIWCWPLIESDCTCVCFFLWLSPRRVHISLIL